MARWYLYFQGMEFGDYYLIRGSDISKLRGLKGAGVKGAQLFAKNAKKEKWIPVPVDNAKIPKLVDVALHLRDDEGSAWELEVYAKGKRIAYCLYGQNAETGVSLEDNECTGDWDKVAKLLGVDAKKLKAILKPKFPDLDKVAKLVGFPVIPITSTDMESYEEEG
jgi:hypothetical protein